MKRIQRWWRRILRDFFAGCALVMSDSGEGEWPSDERRAKWCYVIADAMLKARGE